MLNPTPTHTLPRGEDFLAKFSEKINDQWGTTPVPEHMRRCWPSDPIPLGTRIVYRSRQAATSGVYREGYVHGYAYDEDGTPSLRVTYSGAEWIYEDHKERLGRSGSGGGQTRAVAFDHIGEYFTKRATWVIDTAHAAKNKLSADPNHNPSSMPHWDTIRRGSRGSAPDKKLEKQIDSLRETVKNLDATVEDQKAQIETMREEFSKLSGAYGKLAQEVNERLKQAGIAPANGSLAEAFAFGGDSQRARDKSKPTTTGRRGLGITRFVRDQGKDGPGAVAG